MRVYAILTVLVVTVITSVAHAQTFFFVEHFTTAERTDSCTETVPTLDAWFQQGISGKIGMFAWAQTTPDWRQAYIGPSYQITSWLQVGIGGGIEKADSKKRLGSFLYAAKGKDSLFGVYENGGGGRWHIAVYNHQVGKSRFGIGVHTQAFVGTGPRAEMNFGPIKLWSSLLFEGDGHNAVFGVRYVYFRDKK